MNKLSQIATLASTAALVMLSSPIAYGDDTEIFNSAVPSGAMPNVLLIIDTSLSMESEVDVPDPGTYDPAVTYTAPSNPYPANRIYWRVFDYTDHTVPAYNSGDWVRDTNFVCKTALDRINGVTGTPGNGRTTIKYVAQWNSAPTSAGSDVWEGLTNGRNTDSGDTTARRPYYVECKDDVPLNHGLAVNDSKFPRDGTAGPFGTTNSLSWTTNNRDRTYVFYTSHWLNWKKQTGYVTKSRAEIVQQEAKKFIDTLTNVNVGIMRYNTGFTADGGYVVKEFIPANTAANRTTLKSTIDALTFTSSTPLSETLYSAYQYFRGGAATFGALSVAASKSGGNYISPVSSCEKNIVIFLTDGEPSKDQTSDASIQALTGTCTNNGALGTETTITDPGDGRCLDDLAGYMYTRDFYDDPTLTGAADPAENVTTFTIGFGPEVAGSTILQSTADKGQGAAAGTGAGFTAGDPLALEEAFAAISRGIVDDTTTFTAPAVSVNAFNRTQNLNDLYITMFAPSNTYHWPGNLKRYRIDPTDGVVKDANGAPAVNEANGFISAAAQSYWPNAVDTDVDGADITLGGAAKKQPLPSSRVVLSDLDVTSPPTTLKTGVTNLIHASNVASISATQLGLPAAATVVQKTELIEWIRGDSNSDPVAVTQRYQMGDPLHSRPVSIVYGGTVAAPDVAIYAATNDGYLHAINATDGTELWSFIPKALLARMQNLRTDATVAAKGYGIDGNVRSYVLDVDHDGQIEAAGGDKVWIYFGMGRGGREYYALDVTDKNNPKFMWRKDSASLPGVGQTWSTPVIVKVDVGGVDQTASGDLVAVFGGGYDTAQDGGTGLWLADGQGNQIFMLDARTGAMLWHAGPTTDATANFVHAKMNNAFTGDIRVIDIDSNGYADRMYAGDMGGRVWRFDIWNGKVAGAASAPGSAANSLVTGGVLASLGNADLGTHPVSSSRRFYHAPDVTIGRKTDGALILNVGIGSGYRGHPLNTLTNDRFYMLRDSKPLQQLTQAEYNNTTIFPTLTDGGLVNVTTSTAALTNASAGWKIQFTTGTGEKVLAEARTLSGITLFTTYTPPPSTAASCSPPTGTNALYAVDTISSEAAFDRDANGNFDIAERKEALNQTSIAGESAFIFPTPNPCPVGTYCPPPKPVCLIGVEKCGGDFSNLPQKTFWKSEN